MVYHELDHTADILIRVNAPTLESCFEECCRALMEIMYRNSRSPGGCIERHVAVGAEDTIGLLHDLLSEILCISESENLVFSSFSVVIGDRHLDATMRGIYFEKDVHGGGTQIKGVSFSGLDIFKDKEGYGIDILFDV